VLFSAAQLVGTPSCWSGGAVGTTGTQQPSSLATLHQPHRNLPCWH
jgi:hypothetical protein